MLIGLTIIGPIAQQDGEDIAGTCVRAMQEMQIEQIYAGAGFAHYPGPGPWTFPDGSSFVTGQPVMKIGDRYVAGRVQCIPAPSGMRK